MEEAHIADVVDVNLLLEDDGETLAVQADGLYCGREGELADDGGALCVLDDEVAWREDEGDKGGREEHLDDGNVAIVGAEDLGEGIGMVDSEASGCACGRLLAWAVEVTAEVVACVPTARQLWSWLNVIKCREGVIAAGLMSLSQRSRVMSSYGSGLFCSVQGLSRSVEGKAALPGGDERRGRARLTASLGWSTRSGAISARRRCGRWSSIVG